MFPSLGAEEETVSKNVLAMVFCNKVYEFFHKVAFIIKITLMFLIIGAKILWIM